MVKTLKDCILDGGIKGLKFQDTAEPRIVDQDYTVIGINESVTSGFGALYLDAEYGDGALLLRVDQHLNNLLVENI